MTRDTELYKSILESLHDAVYFVDRDRKITYWNKGAEILTGYHGPEAVGNHRFRSFQCADTDGNQICDDDCHLNKTLGDGRRREAEIVIHHKDGHRVPVISRVSPVRDDRGRIIGAVEVLSDNSKKITELREIEDLRKQALLDPLTGIGNRRYGEMHLHAKVNELQRYDLLFGLLFMDIDNFKRINDNIGHDVGDEVLKMVTRTLSHNLRSVDILSRWGGEEFVAIISHISTEKQLLSVANKLKSLVAGSSIASDGGIINVTISIGATLAQPEDTDETILKRADQFMYQSKKKGGNAVSINFEE